MKTPTNEIKVGALTLGGLAIFLLIISFLGVFSFTGSGYRMDIIYDEVNGLKIGNEVRFAGVPVGKVESLRVDGTKIRTVVKIDSKNKIPVNSRFSIGMDGVLGTKFVSIEPPLVADGTSYRGGEQVIGVEPKGLDQFMESSTKVLSKLEGIADAFNNVFGDKEVQKSMRQGFVQAGEIAKNLNTFTKVMADSATTNQKEIATMVTQLKEMSVNMNQLVTTANDNGATGQNVANMASDMADASRQIKEMAHSLNSVVSDPKTKKDLKETLHNASETSAKANKILSVVTNAKVQADVMYNNKEHKWRTDAGAKLPLQNDGFIYIGGADIGDANRLDLHYNRKLNKQFWMRAGVMEGEFGVGMDYNITPQLKLFTDFYDFTDAKWRLGAEYALTKNLSIIGQSFDIAGNGSETTYLGVRTTF